MKRQHVYTLLPALWCIGTLALGSQFATGADVHYRWTDDRGVTVHSDRPPPAGVDFDTLSSNTSLKQPVDVEASNAPQMNDNPGPAVTRGEAIPQIEKPVEKDPEYCERAKDNLFALQSARVRRRDEQGEYYYLDEQEKDAQRQQAREAVELYCEE